MEDVVVQFKGILYFFRNVADVGTKDAWLVLVMEKPQSFPYFLCVDTKLVRCEQKSLPNGNRCAYASEVDLGGKDAKLIGDGELGRMNNQLVSFRDVLGPLIFGAWQGFVQSDVMRRKCAESGYTPLADLAVKIFFEGTEPGSTFEKPNLKILIRCLDKDKQPQNLVIDGFQFDKKTHARNIEDLMKFMINRATQAWYPPR